MEKVWLKNYPAGVPHEINPEAYRSVAHLLEESFRKNAGNQFSVCMGQSMRYRDLEGNRKRPQHRSLLLAV